MVTDPLTIRDQITIKFDRASSFNSKVGVTGLVEITLTRPSADGVDVLYNKSFKNLITQVGDEYLAERATGISSPPDQVTGMRLGTGTTAVAKTGAGAAIVTYISGSNQAIAGGYPTSTLVGSARRIQWQAIWVAGDSTNAAITEVVLTNETPLTDVAGSAANTVARLVFTAVPKGASDTLTITWSWDILGA